jgi:hypothetical protein
VKLPYAKSLPTAAPSASARRLLAYDMLGVAPNEVAEAPKIKHLIANITGGWPVALAALRASDCREARAFISKYDNLLLPSYVRRMLPIEAFALSAGVSPTRLWGVITDSIRVQEQQVGAIKAAQSHAEIVAVSTQVALSPEGVEDRMAHLKHMGFTPIPKGSTINLGVNVNASATSAADAKSASLPPSEDIIRRMVEARQQAAALNAARQSALPAAPTQPTTIDAGMPTFAAREPDYADAEYTDGGDE